MNEHELNLIAEYAAGSLPIDEVEAVEATIASNPAARAEYDAQLAALAALAAAAPVRLDDLERVRMRRAVAEELHIVREESEPAPVGRRRSIPWARLGTVAAVLAAVVIAAPLLNTLSISNDGASDVASTGDVTAEAPVAANPADRLENATGSDDFQSGETLASATAPPTALEDSVAGSVAPPEAGDLQEPPPEFGELTVESLGVLRSVLTDEAAEDGLGFSAIVEDAEMFERRTLGDLVTLPATCELDADETVPGYETSLFVGFASIDGEPVLLFLVRAVDDADIVGDDILVAFDAETCVIRGVAGP